MSELDALTADQLRERIAAERGVHLSLHGEIQAARDEMHAAQEKQRLRRDLEVTAWTPPRALHPAREHRQRACTV